MLRAVRRRQPWTYQPRRPPQRRPQVTLWRGYDFPRPKRVGWGRLYRHSTKETYPATRVVLVPLAYENELRLAWAYANQVSLDLSSTSQELLQLSDTKEAVLELNDQAEISVHLTET